MADNFEVNAASGGIVFASDDVSDVHYPILKLALGALNSVTLLAGGAGAVSDGVPRVTLASDDPAVALLTTIDADTGGILADTSAIQTAAEAIQAAVEGTLTVGAHAVTNAGTFAVQVDGSALTALQLIDDTVYVDDADWSDGASKHLLVGGLYQATPQTVTDGDVAPFNITVNGALHVAQQGEITAALSATDNAVLDNIDADLTTIIGHVDGVEGLLTTIDTDTGAIATAAAAIQAAVEGTLTVAGTVDLGATDNAVLDSIDADLTTIIGHVDGIETLLGTIDADTGGILTAVQIIDDWDESDRAKVNLIVGQAGVAAGAGIIGATVPRVTEAGGTPFYNLDVDETEDAIKASAGVLYELYLFNTTNAILYVKLYNATTANVTVGSTTPLRTIPVPGNNDTDGAGVVLRSPMNFDTAITIAATTGAADNDNGAPGANALIASGVYF